MSMINVSYFMYFACKPWPKAPGKFKNWTGKLVDFFFFQKSGNPVSECRYACCLDMLRCDTVHTATWVGKWVVAARQQSVTARSADPVHGHSRNDDVTSSQWKQWCGQQQCNVSLGYKPADVGVAACPTKCFVDQSTQNRSVNFNLSLWQFSVIYLYVRPGKMSRRFLRCVKSFVRLTRNCILLLIYNQKSTYYYHVWGLLHIWLLMWC